MFLVLLDALGNVYSRKHRGHKFEPLHALSFWVLFT
jgi:hypothetical protein